MKKTLLFLSAIFSIFLLITLPNAAHANGSALAFDGTNDYVLLNHRALDGLSDCTVEYWVLIVRDDDAATPISAAKSNADDNEYTHYFEFIGGFRPYIHEETPEDGRGFPRSQWFHFALTREGFSGDWIAYINGEEVERGSLPSGALDVAANGLVLGQEQDEIEGRFDRDEALRGNLDELRIWSMVRTPEQIREFAHSQVPADSDNLHAYYDFDEDGGQVLTDLTNHHYDGRLGETDEVEASDPTWFDSGAPIYGGKVDISTEAITFGPIVQGRVTEFIVQLENIAEGEGDYFDLEFSFTDQNIDPRWLEIDPMEGVLVAGESVEITFTANPEGLDLGEYEREVDFEINANNVQSIEMPVTMVVVDGMGRISGTVTDEATGDPIARAMIRPAGNYPIMTMTDENGDYAIEDIPAFTYTFAAYAAGYEINISDEIEVEDEADIELNFSMFHAEFTPDPRAIERSMESDQEAEQLLTISNGGNIDLTWNLEIQFPDLEDDEPWEHLETFAIEDILEHNRIGSAIFLDGFYYIAVGYRNEDNIIYVMNREGEIVREFTQHGVSTYGYRDMTWDGELIWAFDKDVDSDWWIYGFETNGDLVETIQSPENPLRGITWDPEHGHFWACNIQTAIWAINLEGQVIDEIGRGDEALRIYGLSWFSNDEDGYNLYAFSKNGGFNRQINKINIEDGDVMLAHEPIDINGVAGSGFITGLWDPNRYVYIGMTLSPDDLHIWSIQSRSEWLKADPIEGIIEPGEDGEVIISLNTAGLPTEVQYSGTLHFTHNADDGVYDFPVTISIQDEGGITELSIPLSFGWNLISANLIPGDDEAGFADVLSDILEAGLLVMAKNGAGNFFVPDEIDQLGDWQPESGYWLKMNASAELSITGELLSWDTPIDLTEGWNTISYMPHNSFSPVGALSNIGDELIIAKNGHGEFYIREFGFSSMSQMKEGAGYQVKVNADVELVYLLQNDEGDAIHQEYSFKDRRWINGLKRSSSSHSLLVFGDKDMHVGTRIEAYTVDGILAGRGVADSFGRIGIALWGDDPQTTEIEGFKSNEAINLRFVNDDSAVSLNIISGNIETWETDGLGIAKIVIETAPYEFGLGKAFPNPFNSKTIVSFTLAQTESVVLKVYDISGRNVTTLALGDYVAGQHKVIWNATDVPSGIYTIYLKSNSGMHVQKVVLLK